MRTTSLSVLGGLLLAQPLVAQDVRPAPTRETIQLATSGSAPRSIAEDALRVVNAPATARITGMYRLDAGQELSGDLAVLEGTATIDGHVRGRVVALNSDVNLGDGARIDGSVVLLGGRLTGRDRATISGDVLQFTQPVTVVRQVDSVTTATQDNPDERWWKLRQRWRRSRSWSELRLVSARTYNRTEGLPVLIGPRFGSDLGWGRLTIDLLGVVRSVGSFEQTSANLGHSLRAELRFGRDYGVRVGAQLYDLVDPVERWQLSETEIGLSSFFLRRDFADYYNRHGGTLFGGFYLGSNADVTLSYSDQRWAGRDTKNALTLFRNNAAWRPNPSMDEGTFHLLTAALRYDTRNDAHDPWTGWFLSGEYEFGVGNISQYGATGPGVRQTNLNGRTEYDRLLLDLRRYNRVSPEGQLNMRLVLGGWLSGDDLPLERRFSVSGPGALPAYAFRRTRGDADLWQCSSASGVPVAVPGRPAFCERFALAQLEYRGDIGIDPWGIFGGERAQRRLGWGRSAEWVAFVDAGRGWLVGPREGKMVYPASVIPSLGTFRTDIGLGIKLDDLGLYVAKAVSEHDGPVTFFVRLNPRF